MHGHVQGIHVLIYVFETDDQCFTLLLEGECADPAAKGANLQLPDLLVSIGRGDVNKMRTHFL
jgi:hypothetical protein